MELGNIVKRFSDELLYSASVQFIEPLEFWVLSGIEIVGEPLQCCLRVSTCGIRGLFGRRHDDCSPCQVNEEQSVE